MIELSEAVRNDENSVRNKITIITFVCSLLVIWIHTKNLDIYGINSDSTGFPKLVFIIENIWGNLTQIAIPFFFFISGFLFFRTFTMDRIKEKYVSRFKSILIPYIIWCTIYYIFFAIITNMPYLSNYMNGEHIRLSFIDWMRSLWPNEYYTLWFLKELIIYILFCPVLYFIFYNRYIGGIVLVVLLVIEHTEMLLLPLRGCIYYSLGVYVAINFKAIIYVKNKLLTIFSCVFLFLMVITGFHFLDLIIIRILFFIAVWYSLDLLQLKIICPWWMKITFFTYTVHDILLEPLEKIFYLILGKEAIFALLDYIFMPIVVFLLLIFFAMILMRYVPKVWNIITGMRSVH